MRHAQASSVHVTLTEHDDRFEMSIRDNGRGITEAQTSDPSAIGLLGMRERTALMGGIFRISGRRGKGTVVSIEVPVAITAAAAHARAQNQSSLMIRILLVDDHPVARQGIRTVLTDRVKDAVVGEAADAASALKQVRSGEWDLMIADISLPGMSGLELIKEVRRIRPTLPTLVLSMHPASQFARRALSAGAHRLSDERQRTRGVRRRDRSGAARTTLYQP